MLIYLFIFSCFFYLLYPPTAVCTHSFARPNIHFCAKLPTQSNLVLIHHLTLLFASPVAHPFSGKQQHLNNCSEEEIFNAYMMGSLKHLSLPLKVYPFLLIPPCLTEEPGFRCMHTHTTQPHNIYSKAAGCRRKSIVRITYLSLVLYT